MIAAALPPDLPRPMALDLFCGAGGAARGLQRAGFFVVGVDIRPQPRYAGDLFVRGDALNPSFDLSCFDLIWASPPCQHASVGSRRWDKEWPDLIPQTRKMLRRSGVSCVIENVPGAAIRADLVLTGPMFGLRVQRRRHFEMNFFCLAPDRARRNGPKTTPGFCTVAGNGGDGPNRLDAWSRAMGIDWMTKSELREAIPPAFGEHIGRAALQFLRRVLP